jgi:hypothetical protein
LQPNGDDTSPPPLIQHAATIPRQRGPMKSKAVWVLLALFGVACPASAQGSRLILGPKETREFPDVECSFTLPDKAWEWLDPKLAPVPAVRTIAFARNRTGLKVMLRCDPVKPIEFVGQRTYANFTAGMLKSGRWKKLGAKHLVFKGVPSYRLDLQSIQERYGYTLLIAYSNNRAYILQVINAQGPVGPEADTIFENFAFTSPPKPMLQPHDDNDDQDDAITTAGASVPQKAGEFLWGLGSVGFVCLIIFGAWAIIRIRGS